MTKKDKEVIKAAYIIKKYCGNQENCNLCVLCSDEYERCFFMIDKNPGDLEFEIPEYMVK